MQRQHAGEMPYRRLGSSGLEVSPVCLGTMMFGGRADAAASREIVARARDAGINFIDTADVYNAGASEEIVGKALAKDRDRWILATKVGNPMGDGPNRAGLSRRWIHTAADASLKRLATDVIDIYYLHLEDHGTRLEETVAAVGDLIRAGKIRYFGVSNFRSWRIAEVVRLCDRAGVDRPVVSQPYYNLFKRQPEIEQLPVCGHYGLGVVPYSPLARGVLTGKYAPDTAPPAGSRAEAKDQRMMESEWHPDSLALAQKFKGYADQRGVAPGALAIAWLLNNALVTAVLAGPRTSEQLDLYLQALEIDFTAEDEAFAATLVPAGHPSVYGFTDPRYPLEGRPTRTTPA